MSNTIESQVTGGDAVIAALVRSGVDTVFALHGAHIETLFRACGEQSVRLVDVRHESSAGFAAEAYARVRRSLGVAVVTAGPGFTNVITSMANAFEDQTPVLYLAGSAHLREAESNALQAGIDQVALARPVTKWAHRVILTEQIPRMVAQAIRIATSPPCGPVLLDIPIDVLQGVVSPGAAHFSLAVELPQLPDPQALAGAVVLLASAQRPVLMIGQGVAQASGERELLEFAEHWGAPVFVDGFATGIFPSDHPLYGSSFYKLAELAEAGQRPDVILALGVRFGLTSGTMSDVAIPADAKIIQIGVDAKEIGRIRPVEIGLRSDPRYALRALIAQVASRNLNVHQDWTRYVRDRLRARAQRIQGSFAGVSGRIHPLLACQAVVDALPRDCILISDGAEVSHWLDEVVRRVAPRSFLPHGCFGCMGMGLGMAMGAKAAFPDRPVVCTSGDGSIGFAIAEFDAMVRNRLPSVTVVLNNRAWGSSLHFQERNSGPDRVHGTRLAAARYDEVAVALGGRGIRVTEVDAIGLAMREALSSELPTCINVEVELSAAPPNMKVFARR
ncbi:MAG TPA: thiamine pyrophosphate-binding protein [Steroidobacteraceae bacterium]|nr:thiamine pyrophosphate-binding protein [Steroidobacteraceae bacterium]